MPYSVAANGVTHILAEQEGWLADVCAERFPQWEALLDLGAIYLNKVRLRENARVAVGDYIRLHPKPKRFATAAVEWASRLVFVDPEFVIVNKPSGVPVHATIDNLQENLIRALGSVVEGPLLVTHRLDTVTSGLVFLARTPRAQRAFNRALARGRVKKQYLALSSTAPVIGKWLHHMVRGEYAPKVLLREATAETQVCETDVSSVEVFGDCFETRLAPLTGRTHQLRTQMALEGAAILGDEMYGGVPDSRFSLGKIALHACRLEFVDTQNQLRTFEAPPAWRSEISREILVSLTPVLRSESSEFKQEQPAPHALACGNKTRRPGPQ